ncbi:hypothetical protein WJX82_010169 [Trebouxia sp. C0006]
MKTAQPQKPATTLPQAEDSEDVGSRALFYKFTGTIWERHGDDPEVYNLLNTRVCQAFHDRAKYYEGLIQGQPQDLLSVSASYNFPITDATKREELQSFLSQINNANSILLDCKRARIVGLSEPEEGARFNAANLKALSGGDEQKARGMYSGKLTKYYPQFRLFILCNDTPEIDGKDQGLARRIRRVNFSSQFTDIKEPDLENHIYPINVDMTDKLTQWAPEFMLLLLERYRADYNDSCPVSVQQDINEYMQENDPMRRFVQEKLQRDDESLITLKEMSQLCAAYGFTKKSDVKKGLERVLATTCIAEKKLHGRKYVNCFLGYKVLPREPGTEGSCEVAF